MSSYFLCLHSLTCIKKEETSLADDIVLIIKDQQEIKLGEIEQGQTIDLLRREFSLIDNSHCILELWEHDVLTPDDLIGRVNLLSYPTDQETSAPFLSDNSDAHYKLSYILSAENN